MQESFRLLKPFLRGFPIIVLAMVVSTMAAKKYLSYVTPKYESGAKLKLADVAIGVPNSNLFKDLDVFVTSNKIAVEIELLKSKMLIDRALDSLDFDVEISRKGKIGTAELFRDSPILIEGIFHSHKAYDRKYSLRVMSDKEYRLQSPLTGELLKGCIGDTLNFEYGQLIVSLNHALITERPSIAIADQYEVEFLSRKKLIEKVSSQLDIVAVDKDVAVIRIIYKSTVPLKASLLVNRLAETYIQDYINTKYQAAETTVQFLENQIDEVSLKLARSEDAIEKYRNDKSITNIRQETETDLRRISQLKIQKVNLKMNLQAIEELNRYIREGRDNFLELAPNFEAFTDLLSTEIVKQIKQLQAEKKDLLLVYTPKEEKVEVINRKIQDLIDYLIESIGNTKKNLEIKYQNLSKDIEEAEALLVDVPENEKILTILNRDFQIYQQSYNFLNEKKIEAEVARAAKIAFHKIISPAEIPTKPVSPNRPIIIIVSAIMGLFGSIVLIYIVHLAKAKVNDAYTIESNSNIPIALLTPRLMSDAKREEYFLKEAIQLELKGILKNNRTLVFTSHSTKEGRGFHVMHLSRALALQKRKVLLIDACGMIEGITLNTMDLGKPTPSGLENIDYLDVSHPKYNCYSKMAMEAYLNTFRNNYDVFVVNNEPMKKETIGLLMMSIADSNLFVLDSRRTPAKQILTTEILKEEYTLPDIWFVLNRTRYNPNIVKQIAGWTKKWFEKQKFPKLPRS
ncbi:GNVR domain-containing protein [Rapidithrix thailandica]|uniref:GNVR domain-containing protein n=1 Tax=Rapidithrix thailandica TaxID=413964 RepID=A0AAW9RYG4_9BACT